METWSSAHVSRDGLHAAWQEGLRRVDGIAKQVIQSGGATILEHKVQHVRILGIDVLHHDARYIFVVQPLQQHLLSNDKNET